jgi:hypothetical protein
MTYLDQQWTLSRATRAKPVDLGVWCHPRTDCPVLAAISNLGTGGTGENPLLVKVGKEKPLIPVHTTEEVME